MEVELKLTNLIELIESSWIVKFDWNLFEMNENLSENINLNFDWSNGNWNELERNRKICIFNWFDSGRYLNKLF